MEKQDVLLHVKLTGRMRRELEVRAESEGRTLSNLVRRY